MQGSNVLKLSGQERANLHGRSMHWLRVRAELSRSTCICVRLHSHNLLGDRVPRAREDRSKSLIPHA